MMKKPLAQLIGAGIVLAVFVVAYSAWFVVVERQSAKVEQLRGEIFTKSQASERIAAAKSALSALENDEAIIAEHFVPANDVVPFLERLQTIGSSLGSRVQIVSVAAEQGKGRGRLNLSVRITGSFDAVIRTIGAFEYAPYDLTLSGITLDSRSGDGKGARTWEASATFSVGTASTTPAARSAAAPPVPITSTTSPSL